MTDLERARDAFAKCLRDVHDLPRLKVFERGYLAGAKSRQEKLDGLRNLITAECDPKFWLYNKIIAILDGRE